MNKRIAILMLIGEIVLLFLFGNLSILFRTMEEREIESFKQTAGEIADLLIRTDSLDAEAGAVVFFSLIREVPARKKETVYDPDSGTLQLVRPRGDGTAILFVRNAPDPVLRGMKRVSGLFRIFVGLTALFLVITGFYLIRRFRRKGEAPRDRISDPFQDYLAQLKHSETSLRTTVEAQQETVSHQQELNRSIIRHINAAIVLLDSRGKVELFNHRAEKIFGRSAASVLHLPAIQVFSHCDELAQALLAGSVQEGSRIISCMDRDFRVDLSAVGEEGTLVVMRDVTRERRRAKIRRRNSSFAMLGEMAAYLTHEMRNSLGAVFGYTKTLKGDEERVGKINKEITYLTGMMDNFLNFAKPLPPGERVPVNFTETLAAECADAGLEAVLPEDGVTIQGEPGLVRSLCSNLARNAAEAGAGKIELSALGSDPLELRLRDNGAGIPQEQRDKIWFPFFTTREKGTGMGLALVRKIMNALDGDIKLEDSLEKGTEFRLTFFS